jgi:hypothetical protein
MCAFGVSEQREFGSKITYTPLFQIRITESELGGVFGKLEIRTIFARPIILDIYELELLLGNQNGTSISNGILGSLDTNYTHTFQITAIFSIFESLITN